LWPEKSFPFDLDYLPATSGQGLVAFRPAEIARQLPAIGIEGPFRQMLGVCLTYLVDCDPALPGCPDFADLEQWVLGLNLSTALPTEKEQGRLLFGAGTPCCLRTVKPFDWAGSVRKWFPKAEKAGHAGRDYFRMPCKMPAARGEHMGIFLPDGQTLVFGSEAQIRELLDRLQQGKPAPVPPPGWEEVSRDLIAVVIDQRTVPCIQGKWPESPQEVKDTRTLVESVGSLAVGLTVGDQSVVKVVATARDPASAERAVTALNRLTSAARTALAGVEGPHAERARLLADAIATRLLNRDDTVVRGRIELPCNPFQMIAEAAKQH
jgi:hypothetical protein